MTTVAKIDTKTGVQTERRTLVRALERLACVLPRACTKPILQCVRIEAKDGLLWLAATNLETGLTMTLPVQGELPRCVVPCRDLLQRVKASKSPVCELWLEDNVLAVNGGAVEHRIRTQPVQEYPSIRTQPAGKLLLLPAGQFREAMEIALTGAARESTRYAINGVFLEAQDGARLVATDGRRLVTVELDKPPEVQDTHAILTRPMCQLLSKLIEKDDQESIHVYIDAPPQDSRDRAEVYVAGGGWMLHAAEAQGTFPAWRDVLPKGGSRFMIDRLELLSVAGEVSKSCTSSNRGITLRLGAPATTVSARSEDGSASCGQVKTRFLGGSDSLVVTGFNPQYLLDVVESIPGQHVIVELKQNTLGTNGKLCHAACVFSSWTHRRVRWVVMPITTGVEPSRDSLGSNYRERAVG